MFCRKVYIFLFLWTCAIIARSVSLTRHSQKSSSAFENGRTRAKIKMVRHAVVIVDEDFEIPSPINNHENSSETVVVNEYEGSGLEDEFIGGKETSKTTIRDDKLKSEYLTKTSTIQTTNAMKTRMEVDERQNISTLSNEESSGDGIYLFTTKPSVTEITTGTRDEPRLVVEEIIPDICLNSTCSANDLVVSASDHRHSVVEGTNFTLSCKSNSSNHMLYWYKSNGSVNFLLQAFGTSDENLNFNIPDTKPIHSGKYTCFKLVDKQNCCNLQSDLTVYELPLYQYHLTIIALIAAVCLIICISLSVRRLITLKTYTKQFVEKHGTVKNQLLI